MGIIQGNVAEVKDQKLASALAVSRVHFCVRHNLLMKNGSRQSCGEKKEKVKVSYISRIFQALQVLKAKYR